MLDLFEHNPQHSSHISFFKRQDLHFKEILKLQRQSSSSILSHFFDEGYVEISKISTEITSLLLSHYQKFRQITPIKYAVPLSTKLFRDILHESDELKSFLISLKEVGFLIDEACVTEINGGVDNTSMWWHRDQCGHRFKVYIPFFSSGLIPIEIFLKSHLLLDGSIRKWELYRFDFSKKSKSRDNPYSDTLTQHLENELFKAGYQTIKFVPEIGQIICFNTNCLHRTSPVLNIEPKQKVSRLFFNIELLDSRSSNYLYETKVGPAGRGHATGINYNEIFERLCQ